MNPLLGIEQESLKVEMFVYRLEKEEGFYVASSS